MKRAALCLALSLLAGSGYAVGETKGLGNIYGPSKEDTLKASTDGARYGLVCDNKTDTWAGLQAFLTAGASRSVDFDSKAACLVTGVSRTIIDSTSLITQSGAGGFRWSHPSATYLTVSGTRDVQLIGLKITGDTSATGRTNWPAIGVYNSQRVDVQRSRIERVNGAGILYGNTADGTIEGNYISGTLADGIHVTNGDSPAAQTNCRNIKVHNNQIYRPGDDGIATVSYDGGNDLPCRGIIMTDNHIISGSTAGYTNAGSQHVIMSGILEGIQGLNAARVEEDIAYVSFKPDDTKVDLLVINPSGTGLLVGRNATNTKGSVTVSGTTGLGRSVYVGSGTSTNLARNIELNVQAISATSNCIEVNGAADVRLSGSVNRCAGHGVVATGTTSNIFVDDMKLTAVGLASPSTYYGIFYNGVQVGGIDGWRATESSVSSTMLAPCAMTGTDRIFMGSGVGGTSTTNVICSLFGTVSNTMFQDYHLRSISTVYDPPMLIMGGATSTTITVPGATVGDVVEASFTSSLSGLVMVPEVTATDTVKVWFINGTLATIDAATGTLRVFDRKRP